MSESVSASDPADPLDWLAELRPVAKVMLTERQYEIWRLLTKGYEGMRIAQLLRCSLRTVKYEKAAIKEALLAYRETLSEGPVGLGLSLDTGGNKVRWGNDTTLQGVNSRMIREVRREGRLPRGLIYPKEEAKVEKIVP